MTEIEKSIRDIADRLQRKGENETPCDDYDRGYRFCCGYIAYELKAALAVTPLPAPEPVVGEPGDVLTAEQMVSAWRQLNDQYAFVDWNTYHSGPNCNIDCSITIHETKTVKQQEYHGYGPDPLRAFSKAVAAFEAATEGGGGEKGARE